MKEQDGPQDELIVWDMYFAAICSMAVHPGYNRPDTEPLNIQQCGVIADAMLAERNKRWQQ